MLTIVQIPAPVLTAPVKEITVFDEKLKKLLKNMEKTLLAQTDPQGVGLAAPQIGISEALFIMKPTESSPTEVCINPKIIEIIPDQTGKKIKKEAPYEGCLSVPRIWSPVKRAKKVILEYQDKTGKKLTKTYTGFKAVIVQHEVDHLHGILFTQRALEQKVPLYEEKNGKLKKLDY